MNKQYKTLAKRNLQKLIIYLLAIMSDITIPCTSFLLVIANDIVDNKKKNANQLLKNSTKFPGFCVDSRSRMKT